MLFKHVTQLGGGYIRYVERVRPSFTFDKNEDWRLASRTALAAPLVGVLVRLFAAKIGFVSLNDPAFAA